MYVYYNANPFKNKVSDCTIRAISLIENKPYATTFRELSEYALERGLMMDSVKNIESYLDDKYLRTCYTGITLQEFVKEHPRGEYLVTMPNHITSVINGVIYDTFDPSNRIIKCVWYIPKRKRD